MKKITNNTLGAIISLEAIILGLFIGLKMGFNFTSPSILSYVATIGGTRHMIGIIATLILIPIYTQQTKSGFKVGIIIVSITSILTTISIIDLLFITAEESIKAPVPILMLIFQTLALFFSYKALKETIAD